MKYCLFFLLLLFPLCTSALEIKSLHLTMKGNNEHIALYLNENVNYKIFTTQSAPRRIVIDIPSARWRGNPALPADYHGVIKKIRFGFYSKKTTRIVLEVAQGVSYSHTTISRQNAQAVLEFDIVPIDAKLIPKTPTKAKITIASPETSPPEKKKPLIVIDAGHGGQDPGTSGFSGTQEKDFTLEYAKALKTALMARGKYEVYLTRSDDRYLLLSERVRLARAVKGTLFISIHADSDPTASARGLSVYTISEKASDKQAEALAQKENKADVIGGMDLSATSKDVADILIDLTQRETRAKSTRFAELLVSSFRKQITVLNHTHRFAGFAVLKAPDIPSVLIETGFITNPREEKQLLSPVHQEKFLRCAVKAVDKYFSR